MSETKSGAAHWAAVNETGLERRIQGRTVVGASLHPCFIVIHFDDGSQLEIEPEEGAARMEIVSPRGAEVSG
jgi:hypothetical protein